MKALCIVRVPMDRRPDAERLLGLLQCKETHVHENGVEGTIDVYVKAVAQEVAPLASTLDLVAQEA